MRFEPEELAGVPYVEDIRKRATKRVTLPGPWAEFGVAKGGTARLWLSVMPADTELWLFDSFEGLPEQWNKSDRSSRPAGSHACPPPDISDDRVRWVIGRYESVLALAELPTFAFVHIDCDLYASTAEVLHYAPMRPGTVILFDEYHGYPNFRDHEYKALAESGLTVEWFAKDRERAAGILSA